MSAVTNYEGARKRMSDAEWEAFISNPNRWQLTVAGETLPPGTDWSCTSRFGTVRSAVVLDGVPFDRPTYNEAPFVQTIVWGRRDGSIFIGMVEQKRPHADDPQQPEIDGHPAINFLHCPMGFSELAVTSKFETPEEAGVREAEEELGIKKILNVERVPFGHNPSPSFTGTWGGVAFVEVDLDQIVEPEQSLDEPIEGTYFIEAGELLRTIASGVNARDAYTGVATSLSALMLFFASHPEFFPR